MVGGRWLVAGGGGWWFSGGPPVAVGVCFQLSTVVVATVQAAVGVKEKEGEKD